MSAAEVIKVFLDDEAKFDELVKETFPEGGKALVKDIQPKLKAYIEANESGAQVEEEKKEAFRKKYFTDRADEELDEAGYKVFLREMLTEVHASL